MTDDEIKKLCDEATSGPWQWFGNTKTYEVYLSTVDRGRVFVMDFARWGMSGAQPRFQVKIDGSIGYGVMRSLGDLSASASPLGATFEATHRKQFTGIGHPDARFLAASRELVPDLLARALVAETEVAALKAQLAAMTAARDEAVRLAHIPERDQDESWMAEIAAAEAVA